MHPIHLNVETYLTGLREPGNGYHNLSNLWQLDDPPGIGNHRLLALLATVAAAITMYVTASAA